MNKYPEVSLSFAASELALACANCGRALKSDFWIDDAIQHIAKAEKLIAEAKAGLQAMKNSEVA